MDLFSTFYQNQKNDIPHDLVSVIVVSKDNDIVFVKFGETVGLIHIYHLHDDNMISKLIYQNICENDVLEALIIGGRDQIEFTLKKSMIKFKNKLPTLGIHMKINETYYGYVKAIKGNHSIIGFLDNAAGIVKNIQLPIGCSIRVKVISSGILPQLQIVSSEELEYQIMCDCKDYLNSHCDSFFIGQNLYLLGKKVEDDETKIVYHVKDGYSAYVYKLGEDPPDFSVFIKYIDPIRKIVICAEKRSYIRKRYCGFGIIKDIIDDTMIVDMGGICYLCRRPFWDVNVNYKIFLSLKLYEENDFAYAEKIPLKCDDNVIDCTIEDEKFEWFVCSSQNSKYLLHKTQCTCDVNIGQTIKGKCIQLKGFKMLIINEKLPLIIEDCEINMNVMAYIISVNQVTNNSMLLISPFIIGCLKACISTHCIDSCVKCIIKKIKKSSIIVTLDSRKYKATIKQLIPGLHFIAQLDDESQSIVKIDITDEGVLNKLKEGKQYDVFKYDNEYATISQPVYNSNFSFTLQKKKNKLGYIYGNDRNYLYVHLSKTLNAYIPCEYYSDIYTNTEFIFPPRPGYRINGVVISSIGDKLLLSSRTYDICEKILNAAKFKIYRANVISKGPETIAFIDVLNIYINVKVECDSDICNDHIFVRCMSPEIPYSFEIVAYTNKIFFQIKEDLFFQGLGEPNSPLLPSSDEIEEYDDPLTDNESSTNDNDDDEHSEMSSYSDREENKNENSKRYIIKKKKYNTSSLINNLKPIYLKQHVSHKSVNPRRIKDLLYFLRHHEVENWSEISNRVHLDTRTVKEWYTKCRNDANWFPLTSKGTPTHKAMNDTLEDGIMWYIHEKYLSLGFQFNDQMCKTIALAFWKKYPEHRLTHKFAASNRWIKRFKAKYNLVNRRVHYHRRAELTPELERIAKLFLDNMRRIYEKHESEGTLHLLINVDETSWKIGHFGDLTWASKGIEHVEFNSFFNDKESITAIAAVSASKDLYKLPLCIIKAGQSNQSMKILNSLQSYFQIEVTESGWSTTKCFANYLFWLRQELNARYKNIDNYTPETEIDLVFDLHASHRNAHIKHLAELLHFNIHYIPSGLTDVFQPLDRYIFGSLKMMAKSEWYKAYIINPKRKFNIVDACRILIKCWNDITPETINKAWLLYSDPNIPDIDSLINKTSINVSFESSELTIEEKDINNELNSISVLDMQHEKNDEEEDDDDDNTIDSSIFKETDDITPEILNEIKKVVNYEKYLTEKSETDYYIKPIVNSDGTCFINSTIQLLSIIPGMREQLDLLSTQKNENEMIKVLSECMRKYDSERIVSNFNLKIYEFITYDVSENITKILEGIDSSYGLIMNGHSYYYINLIKEKGKVDIIKQLKEFVHGNSYKLNTIIFFQKDPKIKNGLKSAFQFDNYIFILKAAVANINNEHYYIYVRKYFTDKFLLVNDDVIKEADIYDLNDDRICYALYYIFPFEAKERTKEIEEENSYIDMTKEIQDVLKEIEKKQKSTAIERDKFDDMIYQYMIVEQNILDPDPTEDYILPFVKIKVKEKSLI